MGLKFTLSLLLLVVLSYQVSSEKVIVCYYGTWATYRSGLGKFDVSHINPDLCTHVVYTFVGINNIGTVISLDTYLDLPDNYGRDNFGEFARLKQKNPNLKTLLAVGGWNEGSAKYSVMAASQTYRNNFIKSAIEMILKHNFDGFDLDWEYPGRRDTVHGSADINNFSQLVKEMKEEFVKYDLLLTAAVSAVKETSALSYDIPTISRYLDYINLMTYDMYGAWDAVTGHNAPLHKGEGDEIASRESLYTVDVSVEYWLSQGCPPEKLVLGVPFYGRTFTLSNANINSVRAPASGAGIAGAYTATSGFIGYNELCDRLQKESWNVRYDALAKVPYAFLDRNWVSYDDVQSIISKVEFGLSYNLAGIMMWSIETDDFNNVCGDGDFPLLRAINKALGKNGSSSDNFSTTSTIASTSTTAAATTTTTTTTPSTTTTTSSQTPTITTSTSTTSSGATENESAVCKIEGYTADPSDCSSFYFCTIDSNGNLIPVKSNCPANLYWDQKYLLCNHAFMTECNI